ncbi:hypothetical protein [Candidatus Magnetobacterium casense]|uniref:Uncharacterized protein n=1 Tax=Candidatus Magnetobacterium casense TaxID=1455061 RepID=A0ABS6RU10_9BACT|nr:hypothetical protein [Candidatus Magnetobacterium casensis]MBV6340114.1 hypothetical protein [Candidatus Magnetobacterium casensis]
MLNIPRVNKEQAKAKSYAVSAVMKNPKLGQMMNTAFHAKVGSTKRTVAKSVLKSLWRTNRNRALRDGRGGDGQGGFWDWLGAGVSTSSPSYSTPMSVPLMQANAMTQQVQGVPSTVNMLPAAPAASNPFNNTTFGFPASQTGTPMPTFGPYNTNTANTTPSVLYPTAPTGTPAPTTAQPTAPTQAAAQAGFATPVGANMVGNIPFRAGLTDSQMQSIINLINNKPQSQWNDTDWTNYSYATGESRESATKYPWQPQQQQQQQAPAEPELGYYDRWFQGLSPEEQNQWRYLYQAVKSGIGAPAFAFQVMSDANILKQMFPNVPEDALPKGALLAQQLYDLQASKYQENNLDQQMSNINDLKRRGMTVQTDLQNYVRGRDEYVRKLDEMITKAKDSMFGMDMANPYVKDSMNKYMNYLYTIKGRQEQRYVDYINMSINEHNADLQNALNVYNTSYTKYQAELQFESAITQERYQYFNEMIQGMYTNLQAMEQAEAKKTDGTIEEMTAYYKMLEAAANAQIAQQKATGTPTTAEPMSTTELNYYKGLMSSMTPNDAGLYSIPNLADLIDQASAAGFKNTTEIVSQYSNSLNALTQQSSQLGQPLKMWYTLEDVLNNLKDSQEQAGQDTSSAKQLATSIINGLAGSMNDYLLGSEYKIADVRTVLQDLTGSGWLSGDNYKAQEQKGEFIEKNQDKLNTELLSFLYDEYMINKSAGFGRTQIFNLDQNDMELSADILNDYEDFLNGRKTAMGLGNY